MIKRNKWRLIISSAVILIPMLVGLLFWDKLPDVITTHWGADGNADGWSGKSFGVYVIPLILLAFHWLCVLITAKDPGNREQNKKALRIVFWIMPFISLFCCGIMYSVAMGTEFDIIRIMPALLGLMFVVIGNYLPKCKQNYTLGIKLTWTIQNEENWNKTHRMGGKVWVIGGILVMFAIFLPAKLIPIVVVPGILIIAFIPMIYSWALAKKQKENGVVFEKNETFSKMSKISAVIVPVVIIAVLCIMFTGNVNVKCGESSMSIEATYYEDIEVEYENIDSIEYREAFDGGVRAYGFGSARLLMGTFQNDEFGYYTRYSYTGCDACVVLAVDGDVLVISGKTEADTLAIYEKLLEQI
ncbi:MAG: DUF1648 domain-containing protein [Ruminococcaceae bacterium]|nr:DUF1648 domain-containing protein [Oscillospiraceae bacterium]